MMDVDGSGPSSRGSRRRPQGEKRKSEGCEREREGERVVELGGKKNTAAGESQGGRKRQRVSEISGVGSWICRESYCGLSLPDQSSLERHYRGHCAQEEVKLARVRVKRRREEGEEEEGGLRQSRRLVLDRLRERREERREGRLRDQGLLQTSRECPLCRTEVENDLMEDHLALCLRVVVPAEGGEEDDEDEDVDVVDEDGWEEYEWAGQRRVRSSSLRLARRQDCSSNQVTIQRTEEEEELDILGDDDKDQGIGNDQTSRQTEEPAQFEALQNAANPGASSQPSASEGTQLIDDQSSSCSRKEATEMKPNCPPDDLKDDLDVTTEEKGEMCKICMSCYSRPLVSTSCWHVHCQTCWLRALGAARVCPQCKAPVKPDDLSRVFL